MQDMHVLNSIKRDVYRLAFVARLVIERVVQRYQDIDGIAVFKPPGGGDAGDRETTIATRPGGMPGASPTFSTSPLIFDSTIDLTGDNGT